MEVEEQKCGQADKGHIKKDDHHNPQVILFKLHLVTNYHILLTVQKGKT